MKKTQLFTSIILAIIMIIAPQTFALASDDMPKSSSASSLIADSFSLDKNTIYAGDTFKLTYKIKNTSVDIKNLNMRLSGGETFTVANDVDTIYASSLAKGASAQFSKSFFVTNGATAGMYPITISATYDYVEGGETVSASSEFSYTVPVSAGQTSQQSNQNSPSLTANFSVNKSNLLSGDNFKLSFKLANKSAAYDISNVNIKLSGGDAFAIASDVDTIYKSSIAKKSTASFSKAFVVNKSTGAGMYPINAVVTYEFTSKGEKQQGSAEFNFSIKVNSKKSSKSKTDLTPQLIISSFNYGKSTISGGKEFTLNFNVKNNSSKIKAQNVLVKLAGGDSFVVADGTDTISIKEIKPNQTISVSKKFACLSSAQSGVYPITATVSFEYIEGGKQSASNDLTMSVPVVQPDKVQFQQIALADKTVNVDEESDCSFQIINMGQTKLSNGTVKLVDSKGKELNSAYVGNIEAGGQFASNYTLPVTFDKTGEYKLKLIFEYENENMDKKSIEQEFKVKVEKPTDPFDNINDSTDNTDSGEEQDDHSTSKIKIYIGCGVGAAAVVIAAVVIIKKRKHKKGSVKFDEKI